VLVVLVLLAVVAGLVALRRPAVALVMTSLIGIVAIVAGYTDATSTVSPLLAALPGLLALVVSVGAFAWLLSALAKRARRSTPSPLQPHPGDELPGDFDRRRFLAAALATGAVAGVGGAGSQVFASNAAAASRSDITLPKPTSPAPALPPGVQSPVAGVSSYLTPNDDFYRVDINLSVPNVAADSWRLRVHGMVDEEIELSYADLLAMPLVERRVTLTCVSNEVGGPYVGNATWIGVRVRDVLERAGIQAGADAVKSSSVDDFTIGTPIAALTDDRDALLAIAMNGEPLPLEHGFPVRMVVPGLYGFVSATKWLVDLEVTRFADFTAYWTERDWSAEAPIKTASRIDVPGSFQTLKADNAAFGGVAWAQTTGIEKVELQIDDGDWVEADLSTQDSLDTWRQWSYRWTEASPGAHRVTVRATDKSGYTQTSDRVSPRPDGATGWQAIDFSVA
jgi:DMSO/TMAO reductase YedYZ molybdopterin-dependent catalytic subunit